MNLPETLHKVPFVRFLIPLIVGIVIAEYFPVSGIYWIFLPFFFSMLFLCLRLSGKMSFRLQWIFGFITTVFFFMLGVSVSVQQRVKVDLKTMEADGSMYLAQVLETPVERPSSVACVVRFTHDASAHKSRKAILYLAKDSSSLLLQRGARLVFSADLSSGSGNFNPGEFDYTKYLNNKGIATSVYIPGDRWKKLADRNYFSLKDESAKIQRKLMSVYSDHGITGDEFAILSALTLGNKEYIQPDLKNSYAVTGASHILAVSGLHVGVVFFVLNFLLGLVLKGKRYVVPRIIFLITALWVYTFVTGLSPSVIRASVMLSFGSIGIVLKRRTLLYNTIAASAFFMLLYNPFYLYDISFQLSYIAVIFIVFFEPRIYQIFHFSSRTKNKIWKLLSVSLAAQLGTSPFALYYFNQFPTYFWLSGLIVVPLSGLVIYMAIALFVFSSVPFLGDGIAFFLKWVVKIMNISMRQIEQLPLTVFQNISYEPYDVFFNYLILFFISLYLVRRQAWLLMSVLCLLFSYGVIDTIDRYGKMNNVQLAVYDIPGITAVNKIEKGSNIFYYNGNSQEIESKIKKFWVKNRLPEPEKMKESFFLIGEKKIFILDKEIQGKKVPDNQLEVDFLIVSGKVSCSVKKLIALFDFQTLIFDSSVSYSRLREWEKQCEELNIRYYSVRKDGAYLMK
jgi:competence protein ComEC